MPQLILSLSDCHRLTPFPGVTMHTFESQHMTLSVVQMQPGAVIPQHQHPHEQIGYMVQGGGLFRIGDQTYQVEAGQMWRIPGNMPHEVTAGPEGLQAIDVFYPVREDMRPS
ncbi:MAG: cupin domain-containing protein [Thermoguttaceae bacterium]|nr:cupin domain-containing protein [Thermoguttaceae bacterium]MDW8038083.1 cupin domain-containing protein [Thermoguttaceae bacterium]